MNICLAAVSCDQPSRLQILLRRRIRTRGVQAEWKIREMRRMASGNFNRQMLKIAERNCLNSSEQLFITGHRRDRRRKSHLLPSCPRSLSCQPGRRCCFGWMKNLIATNRCCVGHSNGFSMTGQGFGQGGKAFSGGETGFGHSDRPFWTAHTAFSPFDRPLSVSDKGFPVSDKGLSMAGKVCRSSTKVSR